MTISEKVAYIKGLADGLALSDETKEGKVLKAVIDVLGDIASEIDDLNENQLDIGDELDALSEDLGDVEDIIFGDLDDDDECCDDDCCCCDDDDEDDDEDEDDDDELEFEATCPECGADIALSEADLNKGSAKCPSCGELLEFEFDGEEDEEEE
ncbi:MAG: hypothetical protein IKQ73_08865 [Oscillospiraceae bacterium]|nr:hypothetical protein [Oscillospiraceae bacterium]